MVSPSPRSYAGHGLGRAKWPGLAEAHLRDAHAAESRLDMGCRWRAWHERSGDPQDIRSPLGRAFAPRRRRLVVATDASERLTGFRGGDLHACAKSLITWWAL
jgi:hypothetical protein